MPWFRVDDTLFDHPKMVVLRKSRYWRDALGLWLVAGCWSAKHLTDGFVPESFPKLAGFPPRLCRELVRAGFWDEVPNGYQFHDWADRQPARSEVVQKREKTRQKLADWRARKAAKGAESDRGCNPVTPRSPLPIPSHPIPEEELRSGEGEAVTAEALRAQTRPREAPSPLGPDWTAERQAIQFQKTYLARRQTAPSMGGRQVADFHQRVLDTAQARKIAPEKLFCEVLDRWLQKPLNERERSSPYACFANAFGELVDAQGQVISPEIKLMQEQAAEALRVVRGGR